MKRLLILSLILSATSFGCKSQNNQSHDSHSHEETHKHDEGAHHHDDKTLAAHHHDDGEGCHAAKDKKDHASCGEKSHIVADSKKEAGCDDGKEDSSLPANMVAGQTRSFGAPLVLDSEPLHLREAIQDIKAHDGKTIKLTAEIDKVCSTKGCWMTFKDDTIDKTVRVRMKGHSFFVPRNSGGAVAIAEGVLSERRIPKELLQHYADETPGDNTKHTEDGIEYIFTANGVQISMPNT